MEMKESRVMARPLAWVTSGVELNSGSRRAGLEGGMGEEEVSLDLPSLRLFSRQVVKCDWSSGPHLAQGCKGLRS